jgi:hypothetical protein
MKVLWSLNLLTLRCRVSASWWNQEKLFRRCFFSRERYICCLYAYFITLCYAMLLYFIIRFSSCLNLHLDNPVLTSSFINQWKITLSRRQNDSKTFSQEKHFQGDNEKQFVINQYHRLCEYVIIYSDKLILTTQWDSALEYSKTFFRLSHYSYCTRHWLFCRRKNCPNWIRCFI